MNRNECNEFQAEDGGLAGLCYCWASHWAGADMRKDKAD